MRIHTWSALTVLAIAVLGSACGTTRPVPPEAKQGIPRADDFTIVDCLLPGQIRQLGGQVTYVTARRATKTTGRDCEIRGGEYVAFDRANYATALKVWLPLAEQGDLAAQTYVGEIFEKGLGVAPDHQAAAQWYRRAAEKGHSRAAINLGSLYERGVGVARDPDAALNWYRRAAGVDGAKFELTAAPAPEVARLRTEIAELNKQLETKGKELDRSRSELENLRQQLQKRGSESDAERRAVEENRRQLDEARRTEQARVTRIKELEENLRQLQQKRASESDAGRKALEDTTKRLDEARRSEQARASRVQELEKAVAEREARLAAREKEATELQKNIAALEAKTRTEQARLAELRTQVASGPPTIELIEPELLAARSGSSRPTLRVEGERVTVVGRVNTSDDQLVALTINGRDEKLHAKNIFKTEVKAPARTESMRIAAVDRAGRRATLEFDVLAASGNDQRRDPTSASGSRIGIPGSGMKGASFGSYHALVIGNNQYRFLPKLKTAETDAREMSRVLETQYGFKVRTLVNATRYEILAALNDLRERLTDNDNLVVYYAGHGEIDERNQRGHWLPVDAEPNSSANWISNVSLTDIFNTMSVRHLLVVADSCYAGILTRSAITRVEAGLTEAERVRLLQVMAAKRSRMVMTSGGVEPVLDGGGGVHSAFAKSLLSVLNENVGVLPGQELFQHLRLRVVSIAERLDMRQVPEYAPMKFAGHESGDFVFVRRN
jgi:hypothetical protein